MNSNHPNSPCRDLGSWRRREDVFEKFEDAWRSGTPPTLEAFLDLAPPVERNAILLELVKIDLEYRWKHGQSVRIEEYLLRFPELDRGDETRADLIGEEIRARRLSGRPPTLAELTRRFPTLSQSLEMLIPTTADAASLDRAIDTTSPATAEVSSTGEVVTPPRARIESLTLPWRLGRYELREAVGEGGFATVYRGWDAELRREVAVKLPRPSMVQGPETQARLMREAQSAARLRHSGIVPIHEVGDEAGRPFIVYDFVTGPTLAAVLRDTQPAPQQCAAWVAEIAEALDYAHQCGVIHRDVKPANVMFDGVGRPLLADFGLARRADDSATLTQEGDLLGTPAYMSPEQAAGRHRELDGRSDVYSLGVVLYEGLCGQLPFSGGAASILQKILREDPHPPRRVRASVPSDLETICLKAMAKEPQRRYQTAGDLAADLRRFLNHEPIRARRVGSIERLTLWCRRRPAQAGMAGTLLLLLVSAVAAGFWFQSERAEKLRLGSRDIESALTEARTLGQQAERVRHEAPEWRAVMASALAAIQRAERQLDEHAEIVGEELRNDVSRVRHRLNAEEKDRQMLERLDGIADRWAATNVGRTGFASLSLLPEYVAAFSDYGLPVDTPPHDAADNIRGRPEIVRQRIEAAIHFWMGQLIQYERNEQVLHWLYQVLSALDPDEWREAVRTAIVRNDRASLERLTAEVDVTRHSLPFLNVLAVGLDKAGLAQRSVDLLERAQFHSPDDFWHNHNLGVRCGKLNQFDKAARYLAIAAALRPDSAGALCNLGIHLQLAGEADLAEAAFRRAIAADPKLALSYSNLCNLLLLKGDVEGALDNAEMGVELAPHSAFTQFLLGRARWSSGDSPGAIVAYRAALGADPKYADVYVNLGVTLHMQGDIQGAIDCYRKAIEYRPGFALAHSNLGEGLLDAGDPTAALVEYKRAVELLPDYADAWCGLGFALKEQGELADALDAMRRGHKLGTEQARPHPSAKWLAEIERLVEWEERLPGVLAGTEQVEDVSQMVEFAQLLYYKRLYGRSAQFWRAAFVQAPRVELFSGDGRFRAACAAARAVDASGENEPPLSDAEKLAWRQTALSWLRAELTAMRQTLEGDAEEARTEARRSLGRWQCSPSLATLRDDASLARLPAEERQAWRQFWADVDALLAKPR